VDQPILLFRSEDDHVVEASNAEWILAHVSSTSTREVILHDSYHVATLDNDADIIESMSADFIIEITGK